MFGHGSYWYSLVTALASFSLCHLVYTLERSHGFDPCSPQCVCSKPRRRVPSETKRRKTLVEDYLPQNGLTIIRRTLPANSSAPRSQGEARSSIAEESKEVKGALIRMQREPCTSPSARENKTRSLLSTALVLST